MVWSWSHTQEAYAFVQGQLFSLPDDRLCVIMAEWKATEQDEFTPWLNLKKYRREVRRAHSLIRRGFREGLVEELWGLVSEQATCTNGGWNAWLCPYGCGCHMAPFGPDEN